MTLSGIEKIPIPTRKINLNVGGYEVIARLLNHVTLNDHQLVSSRVSENGVSNCLTIIGPADL